MVANNINPKSIILFFPYLSAAMPAGIDEREYIRKNGFKFIVIWASLALVYLCISFCFPICNHCVTLIIYMYIKHKI